MSSTPPSAPSSTLTPTVLAQRYQLDRRLAQGGMAEVWVATDLQLSRQVAVKLLKPALAADPVVAERFRREAIAVASLSHPNIVAVYDTVEETIGRDRRQAVVMQLVNGKSLRQLLDEKKRLSPDLTMHIGVCVAAALDCAHRNNLVHRDVKPGNILVTADGRVLLTDFGIAKGLTPDGDDDLTSPNIMMGTAKYLSPEQVRGKRLDGRADLYSLGLVLYECLAGRVPFLGETDADTALARLNREPTDITRLRPTLPDGLATLIHRLLARRPNDRYASGIEVKTELQRISALPKPDLTEDATRLTSTRLPRPSNDTGQSPVRTVPVDPVGGYRPVAAGGSAPIRPGRPSGNAVRAADRTPPSTQRPVQQPNRKYEQRHAPSMFVMGGLVVLALVVGLGLWMNMTTDSTPTVAPTTTVLQTTTLVPTTTAPGALTVVPVAAISSFDPDGTDDVENPDQVNFAIDGDPSTGWTTVCYKDRYLGGKRGVGVVLDLGAVHTGTVTIDLGSAPFQLRVYAAPDGEQPDSFNAWGEPVGRLDSRELQSVQVQLVAPARYILVSIVELAESAGCTKNPYQGEIREIVVTQG